MKAIHADPKEIRKIFADNYIIPDFQRPYSWTTEECDKLWEDFVSFYEHSSSSEDKYFLGNIVIHKETKSDAFSVIDGQQRLTTLLLLIKAFHTRAGTVNALEECLKQKDPLTSALTNNLKIDSRVIEKDKEILYSIVMGDVASVPESQMKANFEFFLKKIDDRLLVQKNITESLHKLILTLLDKLVILPIHCCSEDDALTIFETINNRGMSLTDADIFKAKLHYFAGDNKDDFIKSWKLLKDDEDNYDWYFRIFMHILRAKSNDISKEKALRAYFTENQYERLMNWQSVISSLDKIHIIDKNWIPDVDANILRNILMRFPNYYWNYPLYVFLFRYGKIEYSENGNSILLTPDELENFKKLISETLRYFYIKGIVYNSVNAIKDTVFKVCASVFKGEDPTEEYRKNITESDINDFFSRINKRQYGRYLKGLVLLSAYLNPMQDKQKFLEFLSNNSDIEHILPKKWVNYDGWDEEEWKELLNSIGNLMPLEKSINIHAQNSFFSLKRNCYKNSKVQDAIDLAQTDCKWTPCDCRKRNKDKYELICDFFKGQC